MLKIPKFSAPLTKFIRTLEGLLVLGSNVALVVIPIVTTSLTAPQAVKYGVILNTGAVFSRSLLKGIAALGMAGAPTPAQIVSANTEKQILQDAKTVTTQVTTDIQHHATPGTIADQVITDLEPQPESATKPDVQPEPAVADPPAAAVAAPGPTG